MLESKQGQTQQFLTIQEQITRCSDPMGPMIEHIQILLDINIVPKFGADWSIYGDNRM